ncbi:MAG: histone family protein DNA-binding protein [Bacteroidetes bacterium]|jgi:DNA-binding protein HU-beta|nr:histone family protein DNA-binding protein [Bacteroidota bacterium]
MNHKELIAAISAKSGISKQDAERLTDITVSVLTNELTDGKTIGFQSFGNFEVRKKEERLSVHPATQIRTLIPPKLVVNFKQSSILKEKLKENTQHE